MTNASPWSPALQKQTRAMMAETPLTPDNHLHFKHTKLKYAKLFLPDLMEGNIILHDKKTAEQYVFSSVEELLQAGWAID